eukprot:CAMPEP_0119275788 /NCGR_PEP_ID=MMETSP1329-20130426/14426_1 /TAXON_ID=114041 /ORGANISM="Genus nov. species nov., Strain RCC1024" /LENGTH=98 /DNA_ID=CAMNT_0007276205 /DNA_START=18 /DNA_END=314 /DNA_ORIENTATION=+
MANWAGVWQSTPSPVLDAKEQDQKLASVAAVDDVAPLTAADCNALLDRLDATGFRVSVKSLPAECDQFAAEAGEHIKLRETLDDKDEKKAHIEELALH